MIAVMKLVLIFVWTVVSGGPIQQDEVEVCAPENAKFRCRTYQLQDLVNFQLPSGNFKDYTCTESEGQLTSFVLSNDNKTVTRPHKFKITDELTVNGTSDIFDCERQGFPCACDTTATCAGTTQFCEIFDCVKEATCFCSIKKGVSRVVHQATNGQLINKPKILSLWICEDALTVRKRSRHRHIQRRALLEIQEFQAIFQKDGLEVKYSEPILTFSSPGTVILRNGQVELLRLIPSSLEVHIPGEFYTETHKIKVIFIAVTGKTVEGVIYPNAETSKCHRVKCWLCMKILDNMECLPYRLQYAIYCLIVLLVAITIIYVKTALTIIFMIVRAILITTYQVFRLGKGIARLAFVTGHLTGNSLRSTTDRINNFVENAQRQAVLGRQLPLVLLACLVLVSQGSEDVCSSHQIITSQIADCKSTDVKSLEQCEITTNAQITLRSFDHQLCIWVQNKENENLFSLKITLLSSVCTWATTRIYYTFLATLNYVYSVSCSTNEYCSWLKWCIPGRRFEGLTKEAEMYPGDLDCVAIPKGSGCFLVHTSACLHFKRYYIPKHEFTYEVKSIVGHECQYEVLIEEEFNSTKEIIKFTRAATTRSGGIQIEVLGSYHQPSIHIQDKLIVRVGDSLEAYLSQAAEAGRPLRTMIGNFQANQSYSNHFIYDPETAQCTFIEGEMRCQQYTSYLQELIDTKVSALPLTKHLHEFYMEDHTLKSRLLSTAPLVLGMNLKKYQVYLQTKVVCPEFGKQEAKVQGCYNCDVLASIQIYVRSTCGSGLIDVSFNTITLATQALTITEVFEKYTIRFLAVQKCMTEKVCLSGRTIKACQPIKFCLSEPSINLRQLNLTSEVGYGIASDSGSWLQNWSLPGFFSLTQTVKTFWTLALVSLVLIFSVTTIRSCLRR